MGLKIMFRTCCGMPEGEPKIINAGVEFDLGVYIFIPCAAYSTVDDDRQVARWIFTKQAASFEEAKAGIMTKYDYKQMKKK